MTAILLTGTIGFADRPERFPFALSLDEDGPGLTQATVSLADDTSGRFYVTDGEDAYELVRHIAGGIEDMTDIMDNPGAYPPAKPEAA